MRFIPTKAGLPIRAFLIAALAALLSAASAPAATIFESGTLGPTGQSSGTVPATNVTANVFTGVRFELTEPVLTSQVGGHFFGTGNFFGALVELDDADDFPDSGDLSTDDVIGVAKLTFPTLSDEVFGDVHVHLDPGWYALVFGSGLFKTTGGGAATRNNPDINDPTYIGWQPGDEWLNLTTLSTIFVNHDLVVKGASIPEPSAFVLGLLSLGCYSTLRRRQ